MNPCSRVRVQQPQDAFGHLLIPRKHPEFCHVPEEADRAICRNIKTYVSQIFYLPERDGRFIGKPPRGSSAIPAIEHGK